MLDKLPIIPPILRQHVGGGAFLWAQRARMMHDPAMDEQQLGRIDLRLSAHISACMASGQETLAEAERQFDDFPQAGEIFAWLTPALLGQDASIDAILERIAPVAPEDWRGASGAVAWVGTGALKAYVAPWSKSRDPLRKWLSLTAFSHYRIDPGDRLDSYLRDPDDQVRARALRLLGELGLTDRLLTAQEALNAPEESSLRFCAARSALLLGDAKQASPVLRAIAEGPSPFADAALELIVLSEAGHDMRVWLGKLIRDPKRRDAAIAISGTIDDPTVLEWLLSKADDPDYASGVTNALRHALPFNLDDTNALESDPALLAPEFADRDDGPWVVAERIRTAIAMDDGSEPFVNLPGLRRRVLAEAIGTPGKTLGEWRQFRHYPAWS